MTLCRTPGIYPCNCPRCGKWTATKLSHANGAAEFACTVCSDVARIAMSAAKFRKLKTGINAFASLTSAKHPEILWLYLPGNSLALPPSG